MAFGETDPISTYLFAFAAGPFRKLTGAAGQPNQHMRSSKFTQAQTEAPEVQQITAQGIAYLSNYFAQPFPFPKYDLVLIPGFAYGGMEHAGATFLREESVLFRTAPTRADLLNRDVTVLHELTHQWFGDLVTMRWFDDLWLKGRLRHIYGLPGPRAAEAGGKYLEAFLRSEQAARLRH